MYTRVPDTKFSTCTSTCQRALEEKTSKWAEHRTGPTIEDRADHSTTGEINRSMDVPAAVI